MKFIFKKVLDWFETLLLTYVGKDEPKSEEEPADDEITEEVDAEESAETDLEISEPKSKKSGSPRRQTKKQLHDK